MIKIHCIKIIQLVDDATLFFKLAVNLSRTDNTRPKEKGQKNKQLFAKHYTEN